MAILLTYAAGLIIGIPVLPLWLCSYCSMGAKNKKKVLTGSHALRFFWITRTLLPYARRRDSAPPTSEGHPLAEFCREHARSPLWQKRSARLSLKTSISNRKGGSCCLYLDTGETMQFYVD